MKVLNGVSNYEVNEANFEAIRLALNFMGENYPVQYFHGIAGTAFRIGGICPCAPTCTLAMQPQKLINLLGFDYEECPYNDADRDVSLTRLTDAVRGSIDNGVPAIVWNAFTQCEWDIVTGYDENENVLLGRGSYAGNTGNYTKGPWNRSLKQAGLTGLTALIIKRSSGKFDAKAAEINAVKEAIRHANDTENIDKLIGNDWVFLQGKAAYKRWADDFSKPDHKRGLGDAYCIGIYSSCHTLAGSFLRGIVANYPKASEILAEAAQSFDKESECLKKLLSLIWWNSPELDAERNEKATVLLREAAGLYGSAIDLLSGAVENMQF